ncbi:hypothetical protein [Lewinella cohaerens]|uniref:hypothetical protein n=1 Tax=Lewinella cohaerens TaxID=70995 RepID=UPI0003785179|nr:hypothetical protein [Lewinella cohaerens]
MKASLLFILVLGLGFSLTGQQALSIEPANIRKQISITANDVNHEEVFKVEIKNLSSRRLRLRWDKIVAYQPYAWESQICDKEASYPPLCYK